jgi:hypothetical protein
MPQVSIENQNISASPNPKLRQPDTLNGWTLCAALVSHSIIFFLFLLSLQFFWVNGTPYFVLGDDAMISMRYAWNWAHGFGIFWNQSRTPEGYTNFLLVAVMATLHKMAELVGIPINLISGEVLAFNWVLSLACIALIWKLMKELTRDPFSIAVGTLCLALNAQFLLWGKAGFETTLLVFFSIGACILAVRERYWSMSVLLALAVLTRDDAVLMVAAFSLSQFVGGSPKARYRFIAVTLAPFLAFVLHIAFRLWYYGAPLPNTYFLKATNLPVNFRLNQGVLYTVGILPVLIFSGLVLMRRLRKQPLKECRKPLFAAMLSMLALYFIYVVWVGGDAFAGSRLFASVWFIPCVALGLFSVRESFTISGRWLLALLFIGVSLAPWNYYTAQSYWLQLRGLDRALRTGHGLSYSDPTADQLSIHTQNLMVLTNENLMNVWDCIEIRRDARQRGVRDLSMAVYYAGTAPYFCPEFLAVDLLGKSDAVIAKEMPHLPGRVGHNKYDYEYSLSHYHPTYLLTLMEDASWADDPNYVNQKASFFNFQTLATDPQFREHYYKNVLQGTHPTIFMRDDAK